MPDFSYTAIEPGTGRERQGAIASAGRGQAAIELKSQGLAPVSIVARDIDGTRGKVRAPTKPAPRRRRSGIKSLLPFGRVVGSKDLMLFSRQLATLVRAGVPLLRALQILARAERNPAWRDVIASLAECIRTGGNLSDGLRQYPRVFDPLYVNMAKAGEAGGVLGTVLDRLARFLERTERIKGRVKAAMTYPLIIVAVAGLIMTGLMLFVVPKFEQIFTGLLKGQPLPVLTRGVIGVGNFVGHHVISASALLAMAWVGGAMMRRTKAGTRLTDWLTLHAPVLGEMYLKVAVARWTRTFGALLASRVPMLEALIITREASGNVLLADAITIVHDRVKAGETVADPLEEAALFPSLVTSMVRVGEETGSLSEMLSRIADAYDEEVDNSVAALTSIIEPVMIVVMAVGVGIMVVALFLPIVGVIQHLQ